MTVPFGSVFRSLQRFNYRVWVGGAFVSNGRVLDVRVLIAGDLWRPVPGGASSADGIDVVALVNQHDAKALSAGRFLRDSAGFSLRWSLRSASLSGNPGGKRLNTPAVFGEIRQFPAPLRGAVVARLREAIISGQIKPGNRLIEAQLAKSLKISRPSLREAMRQIEAEGLIEIVPNAGPVVKKHTFDEIRQIRDLRVPIESVCARYFALHASEEAVLRLESAVDQIETALANADVGEIVRAKQLYYGVLTEGCGGAIIGKYLLQFVAMTSYRWGASLGKPGRPAESVFEMRRLLAAIRARDPERAAAESETLARHAASVGLEAEAAAKAPVGTPAKDTA